MSEAHIYPVKENIKTKTHADNDTYSPCISSQSLILMDSGMNTVRLLIGLNPSPKSKTLHLTGHVDIRWFEDGTLNVSATVLTVT